MITATTLWRRGITWTGAALLVLAAGSAAAQGYERREDRREMNQDRREIRQDARDIRQDQMDVRRLARLIAQLDRAQEDRDWRAERRLRNRIHVMLRQETAEARRDLARDQAEMRRSAGEARRDLRDDARDLRQAGPPWVVRRGSGRTGTRTAP